MKRRSARMSGIDARKNKKVTRRWGVDAQRRVSRNGEVGDISIGNLHPNGA
jgi:hypothetical protein